MLLVGERGSTRCGLSASLCSRKSITDTESRHGGPRQKTAVLHLKFTPPAGRYYSLMRCRCALIALGGSELRNSPYPSTEVVDSKNRKASKRQ